MTQKTQKMNQQQREPGFEKVKGKNFLSDWLYLPSFELLFKSICAPLKQQNLYNLGKAMYPEINLKCYNDKLRERPEKQKSEFLKIFLLKMSLCQVFIGVLLSITAAGMGFAGPIVIKSILIFLSDKKATKADQDYAYTLVAIWITLYFLRIFVKQNADKIFIHLSYRAEQVLSGLIFEKLMRMSCSYRKFLEKGDMFNHLTNDVRYIRNFIQSMGQLFSTPATMLAVQVLLFYYVGIYGFTLTFVYLIGGVILYVLVIKMSKVRVQKLNLIEERLGTNLELITSIKHLKLLGWEDLLPQKNLEYLTNENGLNTKYFTYDAIFDLVNSIFPAMAILLIFVLQTTFDSKGDFDPIQIYTMISVIGMANSPIRQIFNQVIRTLDGRNAVRRIDHLLDSQQMIPFLPDPNLPPGTLKVKNLVMHWQTNQSINHFKKREELSAAVNGEGDGDNQIANDAVINEVDSDASDLELKINKDEKKNSSTVGFKNFSVERFNILLEKKNMPGGEILGDRLVILGEPTSGKTTFINTIIGNVNIRSGTIAYGGKMGYVSQKLWFRRKSVRDNIVMGRELDQDFLNKVYDITQLTMQLRSFVKRDKTVMGSVSLFTQGQKRRIAIARAIYGKPDILLLDDPFISIDNQTSKKIYERIDQQFKSTTIIMSTHSPSVIQPSDKVLIFDGGMALEYDTYANLKVSSQKLKKLIEFYTEVGDGNKMAEQAEMRYRQKILDRKRKAELRETLRNFVKSLAKKAKELTAGPLADLIMNLPKKKQAQRINGLPMDNYKNIFKCAPLQYCLLIFLSMASTGVKVLSDWWVGQMRKNTDFSDQEKMLLYGGLVLSFGCVFGLASIVTLWTSNLVAKAITTNSCKSLAYAKLDWFLQQRPLKVASKIGKDYEQIFQVNFVVQRILRSMTVIIATLVLVGLNANYYFYGVAALIIAINAAILYYFARAQRQVFALGGPLSDGLSTLYEQTIGGLDYLRSYNHIDQQKKQMLKNLYKVSVFRINYKDIFGALSILCQTVSLVLMTCIALVAIQNKFNTTTSDFGTIGLTISFSLRLADLATAMVSDLTRMELLTKIYIKPMQQLIGKNKEVNYDEPEKPADWPIGSNNKGCSISFQNVSLTHPMFKEPVVENISFDIKAGENVVFCGDEESGKGVVMSAISKILEPIFHKGALGEIIVDGVDLKKIGRKYITEHIMYLDSTPFIFTGTILDNINPFPDRGIDNRKVIEALMKVKLWDNIEVESEDNLSQEDAKLNFVLKDAGSNLSVGVLQKINIARMLIHKPRILLCESATSALDPTTELEVCTLIKNEFKDSTIIEIQESISPILDSDRVIFMVGGKIKEDGKPKELIVKPGGLFSAMVQQLEPDIYNKVKKDAEDAKTDDTRSCALNRNLNKSLNNTANDLASLLEFLG